MNNQIYLQKSTRKNKKYMVTLPSGDKIHFGARGYEDYTIHKDINRKKRYYQRHMIEGDINTADFWSKNLLWNKPTIAESIKDVQRTYNVHLVLKK